MDWNCDGNTGGVIIGFQYLPTIHLPILLGQCHLGYDRNIMEGEQFDSSQCCIDHNLYCGHDIWVKKLIKN